MSDTISQVIDIHSLHLDEFLQMMGFHLLPPHSKDNEGYITEAQKKQFSDCLKKHPQITSALEIGFNAGHSADHILTQCPKMKKFVSIDLNLFRYTPYAAAYLSKKHPNVFEFIVGDSQSKLPEYASLFPDQKFDLIYIDGNHSYEGCMNDIYNCKALAHTDTILWIDDYHMLGPNQALLGSQIEGLLEVIAFHESEDPYGPRYWAEARYSKK